jgi:hypothetical protein
MRRYSGLERALARRLARWNGQAVARQLYKRLVYRWGADLNFHYEIHPAVRLLTPAGWAGVAETPASLFFGYYGISPWDVTMQQAVFQHSRRDGQLDILVYDRAQQRTIPIGYSRTWTYQQGSMSAWMPGAAEPRLIYNHQIEDRLVSQLVAPGDGLQAVLPAPVQALHPAGHAALAINYRRLHALGSEYGYAGAGTEMPDDDDGIWNIDLASGRLDLLLTLEQLRLAEPQRDMQVGRHYVNHVMYAPDGNHFIFLHRWNSRQKRLSRLYRADAAGEDLRLLLEGEVSHACWHDPRWILVWSRQAGKAGYRRVDTETGEVQDAGLRELDRYGDGHPSFAPGGRWLLTDSYPDRARRQHLLLYDMAQQRLRELGSFLAPWEYSGVARCDLHPRWSPDGMMVSIDSAHSGIRRSYMLDLSALLAGQ